MILYIILFLGKNEGDHITIIDNRGDQKVIPTPPVDGANNIEIFGI